jgi:hypothetical protein
MKKDGRRAARIECTEDVIMCTLDKKSYDRVIGKSLKEQLEKKINFIKNFRVFANLSYMKM